MPDAVSLPAVLARPIFLWAVLADVGLLGGSSQPHLLCAYGMPTTLSRSGELMKYRKGRRLTYRPLQIVER